MYRSPAVSLFLLAFFLSLASAAEPLKELTFFPVTVQFSPVPSGEGWKGETGPLSEEVLRATVDNIRAHGFTGLQAPTGRPEKENEFLLRYAQEKGMIITYHTGALELFGRRKPPSVCVYSSEYPRTVRKRAQRLLAPLASIPRLYNAFTYQDEPFHWGPASFGYNDSVRKEFKKRYGYDLPATLEKARNDPKTWLDVLNFRSDYFPDGWRRVYRIIKEIDPRFKVVLTHDSHNTFGGGCTSHSELAIDDVFHWGGDFADMFVFDIYPYMMFDFRFGEPARFPKPRMSQFHYSMAQMRNLTRTYGKDLGFWVGTYNPAWFRAFLCPELKAKYWAEREMSTSAVAAGADFLLTGYKIPVDSRHWESFGEGLRLIQKAGARLLEAPKLKARACMLFPRTQYLQLQEEYFNVGLSFELFLRAFGELDILHEEQVVDDDLCGYKVLVLFDVKLLPKPVAEHIASFVEKGGLLIADCVPVLDSYKKPVEVMKKLFGVKDAETDRIRRFGHWVPRKDGPPAWANRPENAPDESRFKKDRLKGVLFGRPVDLPLVSPRPCKVTDGEILLKTASGSPGLVHRRAGKGHAYLLCFCLQDTYFEMWKNGRSEARSGLRRLLNALTAAAGVYAHVFSDNPDIEAALRLGPEEGFLFLINHEATDPKTNVRLTDLPFTPAEIIDLSTGRAVPYRTSGNRLRLAFTLPLGETRILELRRGK